MREWFRTVAWGLSLLVMVVPLAGMGTAPASDAPSGDLEIVVRNQQCLALNVYWEARSEPLRGQQAVAAVTLNRVCDVVVQGGERRNRCQFSWWCDGKNDEPKDRIAWQSAQQIAWSALNGDFEDPTKGALFYHATYVKPSWAQHMNKTTRIGQHLFFANPAMTVPPLPDDERPSIAYRKPTSLLATNF